MRELRDYFCTYEQSVALEQLGFTFDELGYYFEHKGRVLFSPSMDFHEVGDLSAPLTGQALDCFRDLGYEINPYTVNHDNNWFRITKNREIIDTQPKSTYNEAEKEAISKLIKLEKEARNGN